MFDFFLSPRNLVLHTLYNLLYSKCNLEKAIYSSSFYLLFSAICSNKISTPFVYVFFSLSFWERERPSKSNLSCLIF